MKRTIKILMTAIMLMATSAASAENITVSQAKNAAAYYMQCYTNLTRLTADQLTLVRQWNNFEMGIPSMYLLAAPERGWIIMAATTVIDPVVAYADEDAIDPNGIAPQFEALLTEYNDYVCALQKVDAEKGLDNSAVWTNLVNHTIHGAKASSFLLATRWNQGEVTGWDYNMFSPVVRDTVCPTGCVATALAQICKYYEYPKKAKDYKTYYWRRYYSGLSYDKLMTARFNDSAAFDYSLMPNLIESHAIPYEKRYETSRLAYYIGLAVEMQFSPDGSGSNDQAVIDYMPRFFKYTKGRSQSRRYTNDTSFLNTVAREIEMNRPVYMTGYSSTGSDVHAAGHAWVCDGYNSTSGKYHMNWGWGSQGGNSWFDMAHNDMSTGYYNFNMGLGIIIGMLPPPDSTEREIYVGITPAANDIALGAAYPNPATHSITLPYRASADAELKVYNVAGHVVAQQRVAAANGSVTLNVDALPAGVYIYRIGTAHGKFIVR